MIPGTSPNPDMVPSCRNLCKNIGLIEGPYNILRINQSDTIAQDRYAAALGGLKSIISMTFSK